MNWPRMKKPGGRDMAKPTARASKPRPKVASARKAEQRAAALLGMDGTIDPRQVEDILALEGGPEFAHRLMRSCTEKRGYRTRLRASRVVAAMVRRGDGGLVAYRCDLCGLWHVGHVGRKK